MECRKLQIGCLPVIAYISFLYVRERRRFRPTPFDGLLAEVFLDIRPQVEAIHAQVQ